eukprot:6412192-Amphidinium_carterae.1
MSRFIAFLNKTVPNRGAPVPNSAQHPVCKSLWLYLYFILYKASHLETHATNFATNCVLEKISISDKRSDAKSAWLIDLQTCCKATHHLLEV